MTVPTDLTQSYAVIGNAEDVHDKIYRVAQEETPLYSSITKKQKASNVYHEWQTQALASVDTSNYAVEGDDATLAALTATVRVGNRTQILTKNFGVSGTQQAVNSYGRSEELGYQRMLKSIELKRDVENFLLQNNASVTGNASTAREMGGLPTWLTSNVSRGVNGSNGGFTAGNTVAATDGTQRALTESLLKNVIKTMADNGATADIIMANTFNRQVLSTFTGNATRFKDATSKQITATVGVYESDFGKMKIVTNYQQRDREVFLIDSDMIGVATLRPMKGYKLAKNGDNEKEQMVTELTLVVHNQAAHGIVADLTTS